MNGISVSIFSITCEIILSRSIRHNKTKVNYHRRRNFLPSISAYLIFAFTQVKKINTSIICIYVQLLIEHINAHPFTFKSKKGNKIITDNATY